MPGIKGEYIYDDKGNIIDATGGLKTAMTNKQKYGSEWYKKLGKLLYFYNLFGNINT